MPAPSHNLNPEVHTPMPLPRPVALATLLVAALAAPLALAQDSGLDSPDPKERIKALRQQAKQGTPETVPAVAKLVEDPVVDVRAEAVETLRKIGPAGGARTLDGLELASRDNQPAIQILAVDGLVDFYYPGYVKEGFFNSVKGVGKSVKNRFSTPSPIVVSPAVAAQVTDGVQTALGRVTRGGTSLESRANAARAAGILRAQGAVPDLKDGLESRDKAVVQESARSLLKIGDPTTGESLRPLLAHSDQDIKITAIQAMGQLQVKESAPELGNLVRYNRKKPIRRESLIALAKLRDPSQKKLFDEYFDDKDPQLRAASAEGIGRLEDPADLDRITEAFATETKSRSARFSLAFAAVYLGDVSYVDQLVEGLNSSLHRGEARPFLVELARKPEVLEKLYGPMLKGTKDQKRELATVVAYSGNADSLEHLRQLEKDPDGDVASAATNAVAILQSRMR